MKSTVRLFRAVPVETNQTCSPNEEVMLRTIKSGFILSPEVFFNYGGSRLENLVTIIEKEIGLSGKQANSAFHKSWDKIREASMEQLVLEQLVHYFTTYGMEHLGIYDEKFIYVPFEELDIPDIDRQISLVNIKGYTKDVIKQKLMALLGSGIAFSTDTIADVLEVTAFVGMDVYEIE